MRTARHVLPLAVLLLVAAPAAADGLTRPGEGGPPTPGGVTVFVIDLDDVDDAKLNFTANFYVGLEWHDPRLAHEGPGIEAFPLAEVWHPWVQVLNRQRIWDTLPSVAQVKPDGTVLVEQRYWGQLSQPLDLKEFPFDSQSLSIRLVSAEYGPSDLTFLPGEGEVSGISPKLSVPDWEILGIETEPYVYSPIPGVRERAAYHFTIQAERLTGYYYIKIITPLLFIVAMSWIAFWIDPKESGSQISVSVTSMLTLIAYRFAVGATLPKVSYLTRMDHFILLATVLIFATLVEVVVTSTMAKGGKLEKARRIDRHARWVAPMLLVLVVLRTLVI